MTSCIVESARNPSKVSVVMDLVRNRLLCVSSPNLWLAEPYFLPLLYYLSFFWSPRLMRRPLPLPYLQSAQQLRVALPYAREMAPGGGGICAARNLWEI